MFIESEFSTEIKQYISYSKLYHGFLGGGANCLTIVSIIHLDIYIVQYISIIQYKCQVIIFIVLWIYSFAVGGSFSSSAGGLPGT